MRECVSDLAPVLWHSCGTISVLIQVPQTRFTMFTVWRVGGNTAEYWWVKKIMQQLDACCIFVWYVVSEITVML